MKRSARKKKYPWEDPKLTQAERTAAWYADREKLDRRLERKIEAWARAWERCPGAGCRRNARCLRGDQCYVLQKPTSPEQEEAVWRSFRQQLRALTGEPPLPELDPRLRAWAEGEPSAAEAVPSLPSTPHTEEQP